MYVAVYSVDVRAGVLAPASESAEHQQHQRSVVLDADADDVRLLLQRLPGSLRR